MNELVLRLLTPNDESAFLAGAKLWPAADLAWYAFDWQPEKPFAEYLLRLQKNEAGIELPENFVPSSMFYAFVDGQVVGRLHIRHKLSDALKRRGGHVGYAVAPVYRGKGYGKAMLGLALPICERLGIEEVLLTCADENVASYRIIESAGGRLVERFFDEKEQIWVRRYSIVRSKFSGAAD